jgi:hypothetical protein
MNKEAAAQVVVLGWESATSDRNAFKIAAFLGADVRCVSITPTNLGDEQSIARQVPRCRCLVTDAESLARVAEAMPSGVSGLRSLISPAEHVCIFGWQPTERHAAILQALSSGGLVGVQPQRDMHAAFEVAEGHRRWSGQFSGLSVRAGEARRENVFVEGSGETGPSVMIRLGCEPFFVRTELGGTQVYFLASSELADLDQKVRRGTRPLEWFSRLVPLMMFLRGALAEGVWHNDRPQACFIIDDPLLQHRYGHFEFRRLMEAMRRQEFALCIAFIPWNYRRSRKEVAELLKSCGMPYLCVHGCDHTGGEFSTRDVESLRGKAQLALERMRSHSRSSGVPFDEVMVFPQGSFSVEALKALSSAGYLAAINTYLQPSTVPEGLELRDVLSVAVTQFADFPLFGRHYPEGLDDFAFDLFLGKPALVVEHHGYFRNGYGALQAFVARLSALDERLEWTNPATICSRTCLTRTAGNGDVHVQFYTRHFHMKNDGRQTRRYLLVRRQTGERASLSVTIDGRVWDHELRDGNLEIRVSLEAEQTAEIKIIPGEPDTTSPLCWQTPAYKTKVRVRRMLSEIRDNYVDTNRVLNGIISIVRNYHARRKTGGGIYADTAT